MERLDNIVLFLISVGSHAIDFMIFSYYRMKPFVRETQHTDRYTQPHTNTDTDDTDASVYSGS